jgi:hypothetical protein
MDMDCHAPKGAPNDGYKGFGLYTIMPRPSPDERGNP